LSSSRGRNLDNLCHLGYILSVAPPRNGTDRILFNARVHATPGEVAGSAVGIRDGRVAAVGSDGHVRSVFGPEADAIDLEGRVLLPAFIDSHTHFHRGAVLQRLYLDFETLRPTTVGQVLDAVSERASTSAAGAWVEGDSLSGDRLAERRLPDRHELDRVSHGHPVVLRGIGKHVVAANSLALAAAGIDRQTPDPPGGRIERDGDGNPTGLLHERAKLRLDQSHPDTAIPKPSRSVRLDALEAGFASLHRSGITTIHEMVRLPEEADDYALLRAEGRLHVRVRLYYRVHESPLSLDWLVALGIRHGLGDDWLRILGIKISVDGFCIFRNAAVYEPYAGEDDNCGLLRIEPRALCELVATANSQGLNVAVHAVGARAVDAALDAFEAAGTPIAGPHRLEHGYVDVDRPRLRRARDLGLAWSVQPAFLCAYEREWSTVFEPVRRRRLMPLRTGLDLGLPVLFNSDFPCAPFDPLDGLRHAVAPRTTDTGATENVTVREAWRAWATTPAEVAGDRGLGRIETGSLADLVVVDGDPFDDGADAGSIAVRATMLDGEWAYDGIGLGG
jgi:predicted amidohydrolase YtcJ